MAATFSFSETYGNSGSPTTADSTKVNFLSSDGASGSDTTTNTAANPITIPAAGSAYSYERWVRGHWTGTFTSISAVTFYKYSGTIDTGVTLNGADRTSQTYATPVVTESSIATTACTSWDASGEAFTLGYSSNYSDYVVMQLVIGTTAVAGAISTLTFRFGWNET